MSNQEQMLVLKPFFTRINKTEFSCRDKFTKEQAAALVDVFSFSCSSDLTDISFSSMLNTWDLTKSIFIFLFTGNANEYSLTHHKYLE